MGHFLDFVIIIAAMVLIPWFFAKHEHNKMMSLPPEERERKIQARKDKLLRDAEIQRQSAKRLIERGY